MPERTSKSYLVGQKARLISGLPPPDVRSQISSLIEQEVRWREDVVWTEQNEWIEIMSAIADVLDLILNSCQSVSVTKSSVNSPSSCCSSPPPPPPSSPPSSPKSLTQLIATKFRPHSETILEDVYHALARCSGCKLNVKIDMLYSYIKFISLLDNKLCVYDVGSTLRRKYGLLPSEFSCEAFIFIVRELIGKNYENWICDKDEEGKYKFTENFIESIVQTSIKSISRLTICKFIDSDSIEVLDSNKINIESLFHRLSHIPAESEMDVNVDMLECVCPYWDKILQQKSKESVLNAISLINYMQRHQLIQSINNPVLLDALRYSCISLNRSTDSKGEPFGKHLARIDLTLPKLHEFLCKFSSDSTGGKVHTATALQNTLKRLDIERRDRSRHALSSSNSSSLNASDTDSVPACESFTLDAVDSESPFRRSYSPHQAGPLSSRGKPPLVMSDKKQKIDVQDTPGASVVRPLASRVGRGVSPQTPSRGSSPAIKSREQYNPHFTGSPNTRSTSQPSGRVGALPHTVRTGSPVGSARHGSPYTQMASNSSPVPRGRTDSPGRCLQVRSLTPSGAANAVTTPRSIDETERRKPSEGDRQQYWAIIKDVQMLKHQLKLVYIYYCQFYFGYNNVKVLLHTKEQFVKLCRDMGVLKGAVQQDAGFDFSLNDIDAEGLFNQVLLSSQPVQKDGDKHEKNAAASYKSTKGISFDMFTKLLFTLSIKCYPKGKTSQDSLCKLLISNVLPWARKVSDIFVEFNLKENEISNLQKVLHFTFQKYSHAGYSTISQLLSFAHDHEIVPVLISKLDLCRALMGVIQLEDIKNENSVLSLNFQGFVKWIYVVARVVFSKPNFMDDARCSIDAASKTAELELLLHTIGVRKKSKLPGGTEA